MDGGKTLRDLATGFTATDSVQDSIDRALKHERDLAKLTAIGAFGDDPVSRIARGLDSPLDAARKVASAQIGLFDPIDTASAAAAKLALGLYDPFSRYGVARSAVEEAIGKIGSSVVSPFDRAYGAAARLATATSPMDKFHSEMEKRIAGITGGGLGKGFKALGIDQGTAGVLARSEHWASRIGGHPDFLSALLGRDPAQQAEINALKLAAAGIATVSTDFKHKTLVSGIDIEAALGLTTTKMSVFAGAIDVLGPSASASRTAYNALLGGYSSADFVETRFWRDPSERVRIYRDQGVDEGLIDTDNAATIAVLIESGVVEGSRTRAGTMTAVVEAGPVRMKIVASRPKAGAHAAIDAFEISLRAFVAAKLEEAHGPDWFKQRVPGDVLGRAKERRREAMRSGEAARPLIHFTDLGDMISIIVRKNNWGESFEAVFDRMEWLRVDLERLTALRRPTMHSRPIDPAQLGEIVFTIRRLAGWMERDGRWSMGWDEDR